MKFTINTHPNLEIVDPVIELVETVDHPNDETFTPRVILSVYNSRISHTLPPQPYVDGTWTDDDVNNAITAYFNSIDINNG